MKSLLGATIGAWLAACSIALLVRLIRPKNTAITCAYCGYPVPMFVADEGGIGAVNQAIREHLDDCPNHPIRGLRDEVADQRATMQRIWAICGEVTRLHPDHPLEVRRKVDAISHLAASHN